MIRVACGGTLTVDGALTANGAGSGAHSNGGTGGGGAGGTIRLEASTFAGSGTLQAHGGSAGSRTYCCSSNFGTGGGGAGGRIVVRARTHTFSSWAGVTVSGGSGGSGSGTADGAAGAQGTVAFLTLSPGADTIDDTSRADDAALDLRHVWRWEPAVDGPYSYERVTAHPGALIVGGGGDATIQAATLTVDGATWDTTLASTNGPAAASHTTLVATTLTLSGANLSAGSGHDWAFQTSGTFTQTGGTTSGRHVHLDGAAAGLSILGGATLAAQTLEVDAATLAVDATSTLSVDGQGHGSAAGAGAGGTNATYSGGGGGYGGDGGSGYGGGPGAYHGSGLAAAGFGSGGGAGRHTAGGAGGGLVDIKVSGTCDLGGTVSANGAASGSHSYGGTGGGGSGGTISVDCANLTGAGLLRANGGSSGTRSYCCSSNYGTGGGGGGGRVLVR